MRGMYRSKSRALGLALLVVMASTSFSLILGTLLSESLKPVPENPPVKSFTLVAESWGYNGTDGGPELVVNRGDLVQITLIVPKSNSLNLRIDEFSFVVGGEFGLRNGESETKQFLATESGVFTYYGRTSRYGGHRELGLEGTLTVRG